MVEKAGHKRQLQTMRMEWINEGRPKSLVHEDSIFDNPSVPLRGDVQQEKEAPRATAPIFERAATGRPNTPVREGNAEMAIDDLYDATPRATRQAQRSTNSHDALSAGRIKGSGYGSARSANEEPHEDELDALLAEEEIMRTEALTAGVVPTASKQAAPPDYPFEDDMEAMADLDGLW
jgi:replication fork protection complex subunit Csm3/Swi3